MIEINDLLSEERILCKCELKSKKRSLQTLAELLSADLDSEEVSEMDILDALINRERLGSTGLGHGVALPHGRIKNLESPMAAMITLKEGVDFEGPDDQGVDLMVGLIVPENCADEHLNILASLAAVFSQSKLRETLRSATDPAEILAMFTASDADKAGSASESATEAQSQASKKRKKSGSS